MGYSYHNLHGLQLHRAPVLQRVRSRGRPDMMPYLVTDRIVRGGDRALRRRAAQAGLDLRGRCGGRDHGRAGRPLGYQLINLGRGEPVLMSDFVATIESMVGKRHPTHPPCERAAGHLRRHRSGAKLLGYDPPDSGRGAESAVELVSAGGDALTLR